MYESKDFVDNGLFHQAQEQLDAVVVSHHVVNKMRGELHNATLYSKDFGAGERHSRVALDKLSAKDL